MMEEACFRRVAGARYWSCVVALLALGLPIDASVPTVIDYLGNVMDAYHTAFWVYKDRNLPSHYYPSLWYNGPAGMSYDGACLEAPRAGDSCIRITWDGYPWNGILFNNSPTVDSVPGIGFDLTGATRLSGYIRTDASFGSVKLLVGHATDSCGEVITWVSPQTPDVPGAMGEWMPFEIDLTGKDLRRVAGGFGIVFDPYYLGHARVDLDEISFDLPNLEAPRLVQSYGYHADRQETRSAAFIYDQALCILTFCANGDTRRARLVADALIYAQNHDRSFSDGRLRNAYVSGDLATHDGAPAKMPGYWDEAESLWTEDRASVSTNVGNLAWCMMAFIQLYNQTRLPAYLDAAVKLGNWVEANCRDTRGAGGYTGGIEGSEIAGANPGGQVAVTWKSTEMNIDLTAAFARLYFATAEPKWRSASNHARAFVEAMFVESEGRYCTGTGEDGVTMTLTPRPLDVNTWALMALGVNARTRSAVRWAEENCFVAADNGWDFGSDDLDGIWWEGHCQMLVSLRMLGDAAKAATFIAEAHNARNSETGALPAASRDGLTTGLDVLIADAGGGTTSVPWLYYHQDAIAPSCWLSFAELGYNPFWSISTSAAVPLDRIDSPTATISRSASQASPTNSSPVRFAVTFSEPVVGFATGDVVLGGSAFGAGATKVGKVTGSGAVYEVAVSGMTQSGTVVAAIPAGAAKDADGNNNLAGPTSGIASYDIQRPTVTIQRAASQASPTNASPIRFTVVFSEPVVGFTAGKVVLGGSAAATTATVSGSGATYSVAVSGMTRSGTVVAAIPAGAAKDAAGNNNLAGPTSGIAYFHHYGWTVTDVGNEVRIAYGSGDSFPQYAVLNKVGYYRMNFGPGSNWGTSVVVLPAYWSGGINYHGSQEQPLAVSSATDGADLVLGFAGSVGQLAVKGRIRLFPPTADGISSRVSIDEVKGDPVLDQDRAGERFKLLLMSSMHISDTMWDVSEISVDGAVFVVPPTPPGGWIIDTSSHTTGRRIRLEGGLSQWQVQNGNLPAPSIEVTLDTPWQVAGWNDTQQPRAIDPNNDGVGVWAASDTIVRSWAYNVAASP